MVQAGWINNLHILGSKLGVGEFQYLQIFTLHTILLYGARDLKPNPRIRLFCFSEGKHTQNKGG